MIQYINMRVTKISVSRSSKVPIPEIQYGMIDMFASADAEVSEEENLTEAYIELTKIVRSELERQYTQWRKKEPVESPSI